MYSTKRSACCAGTWSWCQLPRRIVSRCRMRRRIAAADRLVVLRCALDFTLAACLSILSFMPAAAAELPTTRLRIRIAESGVSQLAQADLASAGVPVGDSSFDPRTLRLFFDAWKPAALQPDSVPASWQDGYAMDEAALWVPGEEDGRLDAAGRVVFYALGPAGWDDLA